MEAVLVPFAALLGFCKERGRFSPAGTGSLHVTGPQLGLQITATGHFGFELIAAVAVF